MHHRSRCNHIRPSDASEAQDTKRGPAQIVTALLLFGIASTACDEERSRGSVAGERSATGSGVELKDGATAPDPSDPQGVPTLVDGSVAAPAVDDEVLTLPLPQVLFEWTNADPDAKSATTLEGSKILTGTLTNLTDKELGVEVHTRADAGTNETRKLKPWVIELPASGDAAIEVPLDAFGFDFAAQKYSGRLSVKFRVFDDSESGHPGTAYASEIYFHPQGVGLAVYGADLMRTTFRSGDFNDVANIEPGPDAVVDRVLQGTRVTYSPEPRTVEDVLAEGDDAGTVKEEP